MASVAYHLWKELEQGDSIHLFRGIDGYGDGEQLRDFVYVDDVVNVAMWFLDHPSVSGIFNVGTGRAETFNDVARAVLRAAGEASSNTSHFRTIFAGAIRISRRRISRGFVRRDATFAFERSPKESPPIQPGLPPARMPRSRLGRRDKRKSRRPHPRWNASARSHGAGGTRPKRTPHCAGLAASSLGDGIRLRIRDPS